MSVLWDVYCRYILIVLYSLICQHFPPQSLQYEIETIKARIGAEREKIRVLLSPLPHETDPRVQDKTLQQVGEQQGVMSIDQLNIKIRKSLKGHNAKVTRNF